MSHVMCFCCIIMSITPSLGLPLPHWALGLQCIPGNQSLISAFLEVLSTYSVSRLLEDYIVTKDIFQEKEKCCKLYQEIEFHLSLADSYLPPPSWRLCDSCLRWSSEKFKILWMKYYSIFMHELNFASSIVWDQARLF